MKLTLISSLTIICLLGLIACGGDDDTNPTSNDNFFKCKINGDDFERRGIYAYATRSIDMTENSVYGAGDLVSSETEDDATIYLSFDNSLSEGTYLLDNDTNFGYVILENENEDAYATFNAGSTGELTLTDISDTRISGTFTFTATAFGDTSNTIQISEGEFSVAQR